MNVEEIENKRIELANEIKKKRKIFFILIIPIIIFILLIASGKINDKSFGFVIEALIVCVVVVSVIYAIITSKYRVEFEKLYKSNVVKSVMNSIFTDVVFEPHNGISRERIRNTAMMDTGDIFSSSDYVKGKYKNINFECSDVHIQEESTDSDGNTHYYTIFSGQWYIFEFNKNFKSDISVCESGFGSSRLGYKKGENKFQKVSLEDIEFNKMFRVYARNDLEAFYVLTPKLMERLKEANRNIDGKLLFCFTDNLLHIGVYNSKNLHEHSVFKPIVLDEETKKIKDELKDITGFIDFLELDNDYFK